MSLLPEHSALQHERAPRPLPLFLELVRRTAADTPDVAQQALAGLAAYQRAERANPRAPKPVVASFAGAALRDHGGSGPPAVLIASLINPPHILDLDARVSLADAVAQMGRRALLLDWGPAADRATHDVAGHVETLLLPLLREIGEPAALVGYCLGGTMAIAAARCVAIERIATLAAPWHFSRYPDDARASLARMWRQARPAAEGLGALPMEVLQAAFWSLDPARTVTKFAKFAALAPDSADARRFVVLEDWANQGEPLPLPAARELIEDLFGADLPGRGGWRIGGERVGETLGMPLINFTAANDRIVPAATAPRGAAVAISAGHVGMVVGSARAQFHAALARFLDPACR